MTWDSKMEKFCPLGFRDSKRFLVMEGLVTLYFFVIAWRFYNFFKASGDPWFVHIVSFLVLYATLWSWADGMAGGFAAPEGTDLFNGLLKLEQGRNMGNWLTNALLLLSCSGQKSQDFPPWWSPKYTKTIGKLIFQDLSKGRYGRLIALVGSASTIGWAGFLGIFITFFPCSMPLFWRSTLPDCTSGSNVNVLVALGVTAIDSAFVLFVFSQCLFHMCNPLFVTTSCIVEYLRQCLAKPHPDIMAYRRIQILERQVNNVNCGSNLLYLMWDAFGLAVMSLYSIIQLHSELPVPILGLVGVVAFDTIICAQGIFYSVFGQVYTLSTSVLEKWTRDPNSSKDKVVRRTLRACYPLKLHMGRTNNYFDKTTPFAAMDMTINQTVSVILITGEGST